MRRLALVLVLLPAAAAAQMPEPDTLDPRGYFPLAVGNEWEYRHDYDRAFAPDVVRYDRYRIVGTRNAQGRSYFVMRAEVRDTLGRLTSTDTALVRFDSSMSAVVRLSGPFQDGSFGESPYPFWVCGYDAPFSGLYQRDRCSVFARPDWLADPNLFGTRQVAAKGLANYVYGYVLVHGVGVVRGGGGCEPCTPFDDNESVRLTFARVGTEQYGAYAVATEADKQLSLTFDLFPNPARARTTVRLGGPATVEVFDTLGRRMLNVPASAPGEVALDLGRVAPGVYVVRAAGQVRTLVVR